MKTVPVLLAVILAHLGHSQITVLNTGTSETLLFIDVKKNNILVSGNKTYLAKCYGACDTMQGIHLPQFPNSNYRFSISRPDTNINYITASSFSDLNLTYWKTSDGGESWTKKFDTTSTAVFSGVTGFFDTLSGLSFNAGDNCIVTVDAFNTYSFKNWSGSYPFILSIHGDSTAVLGRCGGGCGMIISRNRGNTWADTGPKYGLGPAPPIDIEFLNSDTIFALTGFSNLSQTYAYTTDGGASYWKQFVYGDEKGKPDEVIQALCPKKGNELYAIGRNGLTINGYTGFGIIFKSNDLGHTWQQHLTPFNEYLYDMKFIDDSIALVCGSNGLLFKWNSKSAIFTDIKEFNGNELGISAFPNPTSDYLNLRLATPSGRVMVTVTNVFGQVIETFNFTVNTYEADVSGYPQGMYFLTVQSSSGNGTIRFIKE